VLDWDSDEGGSDEGGGCSGGRFSSGSRGAGGDESSDWSILFFCATSRSRNSGLIVPWTT